MKGAADSIATHPAKTARNGAPSVWVHRQKAKSHDEQRAGHPPSEIGLLLISGDIDRLQAIPIGFPLRLCSVSGALRCLTPRKSSPL